MAEEPGVSPFARPPSTLRPAAGAPATSSPFARPPALAKLWTLPAAPASASAATASAARQRTRQDAIGENLPLGFMAGLVAAAVGAGLWALVTVATSYQISWMAVGVGFLVGWAIRVAGKGKHAIFGIVGALLAVCGCAMGNLLAVIVMAARQFGVPLQDVFPRLTPDTVYSLMQSSFRPMHVFYYVVAIYEGYRFSIVARG